MSRSRSRAPVATRAARQWFLQLLYVPWRVLRVLLLVAAAMGPAPPPMPPPPPQPIEARADGGAPKKTER